MCLGTEVSEDLTTKAEEAGMQHFCVKTMKRLSKGTCKKRFHDLLLSMMETEGDFVQVPCPFCYKKRKIFSHDLIQ